MRNGLLGILGLGAVAVITGCAQSHSGRIDTSIDQRSEVKHHSTNVNNKGAQNRALTQRDNTYVLENVVIHGVPYHSMKNVNPLPGEGPFYLIKREDNIKIFGAANEELGMKPEWIYMPNEVTNEKGEKLHRMPLSTAGSYAVKAKTLEVNTSGIQRGHFVETQEDTPFRVESITLAKDTEGRPIEYFVPRVEESRRNLLGENILPFYALARDENFSYEIRNIDGQVTLINSKGIFILSKMQKQAYDNRPKLQLPREQPAFPIGESLEPQP